MRRNRPTLKYIEKRIKGSFIGRDSIDNVKHTKRIRLSGMQFLIPVSVEVIERFDSIQSDCEEKPLKQQN
jgi:hypothetical protein